MASMEINSPICLGKSLHLKCGQVGCSHVFDTFSGCRKHLNKAHEERTEAFSDNDGEGSSTAANSFAANDVGDMPAPSSHCDSVLY